MVLFLINPSAIFDGTETAHLLICDDKPYFSSAGKSTVVLYTTSTKSIAFCQTSKSLYDTITLIYYIFLNLCSLYITLGHDHSNLHYILYFTLFRYSKLPHHHSPITLLPSLFTHHSPPFTLHPSPFTTHPSPLITTHHSPLTNYSNTIPPLLVNLLLMKIVDYNSSFF